jgi:hypothetical protein
MKAKGKDMEIQKTKNYDQFKFYDFNRELNQNHGLDRDWETPSKPHNECFYSLRF